MTADQIVVFMPVVFLVGAFVGAAGRDSIWRNNASQPMRILSNGRFYKVRDVTGRPHIEWEQK